MGGNLAATTRLLRWHYANLVFALLALLGAAATLALPGPSSQLTGFSSILLVGALALLAGHAWGILVITCAEVLILGASWPLVSSVITSGDSATLGGAAAIVATLTALPGLLLFAATLPYTVEVVIGRKGSPAQRPGEILTSIAAALWILMPIVPMLT